jgi:hypothetical protein
MRFAPVWQAAQPLPVVAQAGVTTKAVEIGLTWQEAAEQVAPAEPLTLLSDA